MICKYCGKLLPDEDTQYRVKVNIVRVDEHFMYGGVVIEDEETFKHIPNIAKYSCRDCAMKVIRELYSVFKNYVDRMEGELD